jgi:hypothetical protein
MKPALGMLNSSIRYPLFSTIVYEIKFTDYAGSSPPINCKVYDTPVFITITMYYLQQLSGLILEVIARQASNKQAVSVYLPYWHNCCCEFDKQLL